jgi:hypothetical protein
MQVEVPTEDPGGRIRWGVNGALGWHFPASAFTLGAEGRVGYQFSNAFSAYGTLGATAGLGLGVNSSVRGATVTATGLSYYYFGAMAELVFGDSFWLAGGGFLGSGGYASGIVTASNSGGQVQNVTSVGIKPGLDVRAGVSLGRAHGPPSFRRGGFNIGIDLKLVFHPDALVSTAAVDSNGNAGASITTTAVAASVVPMLMLGYDAR